MIKKIFCIFIFFCITILYSFSYSFYTSFPIWEDTNLLETNSENSKNFINLESESAILIEQTTR